MSRDRFPPDAIFHKRSGLRDGGFSHAQRKAQFLPKNFIVFLYKLPNIFSCILTKTTLYCNCSKKVLKNSTNAVKHSFTNWLSLFFLSFLLFSSLWSDHTSRSQQSRLGFIRACFVLSEILFPVLQTENWKQKINDEYTGKPRENGTRSTYSVGLSALRGWIAQNARDHSGAPRHLSIHLQTPNRRGTQNTVNRARSVVLWAHTVLPYDTPCTNQKETAFIFHSQFSILNYTQKEPETKA